jgi:hypothetical protein
MVRRVCRDDMHVGRNNGHRLPAKRIVGDDGPEHEYGQKQSQRPDDDRRGRKIDFAAFFFAAG